MDTAPRPDGRWQLPQAHTAALAQLGTRRSVPRGRLVLQEGDPGDQLFVIVEGRVRVYLADDRGAEILLSQHGPGEHFGEMMLDGGTRSANVLATDPCVFSAVSREQFRQYLAAHPDCAHALILLLMARVRTLTFAVGSLALLKVYERVVQLLLSLASMVDGARVITEPLTQREIGARVGASREMVSRIIKNLRKGGYITKDTKGRYVILAEPPRSW
ncbi:MAG: Crp/Fnr family transcriptional regulator [Burkholderiales bacterium]|jgi:CRP/FNR family cyclic AMP-dependent transcriptional regulator|nr:Crp/Fnr family transcriptional regulator [Burkholderiales bacterium]